MIQFTKMSIDFIRLDFLISVAFIITLFSPIEAIPSRTNSIREVTDLTLIESPNGVPLDYSYNETKSREGSVISAPGCPKSIDGLPWVHYGNPRSCHLAGLQGPCLKERILLLGENSLGVCSCECFQYVSEPEQNPLIKSPDGRFTFCTTYGGTVQDIQNNICYDLQTQGPCATNQWLVRNSSVSVTCVEKCQEKVGRRVKYDYTTGNCTYLPLQHFGIAPKLWSETCENIGGETYIYSNILKRCVKADPSPFLFIG